MSNLKLANRAAVVVFTAGALLMLGCGHGGWHGGSIEKKADKFAERIASRLDLNADQKKLLVRIKTEAVEKIKSQKPQRIKLNEDLSALVKSGTLDKKKLLDLRQKKTALNREMEDFVIDRVIELYKTLTPEQRQKAAEHLSKIGGRMKDRQ
ncbi:MAG: Spy/CpxP family protein refolding chaperone [Spirochaetes bacterium]|nr:Spy/CpxP family protein refolding chaperone [Spirochaetota bacterium]